MPDKFDFIKRLGSGYFGEVWQVRDTSLNVERALKVIPPDKVFNPQNFFHEAQILKAVEHPNVVRVEETGILSDGRIYVAMEFISRGSLEDESGGNYVDLTRAKRLMIDVLRGLEHAHGQGILHRDVKPANILVGNALEAKLSDFGLAIPLGADLKALGVKEYAYALHLAPELYAGTAHSVTSDLYACGATLYRLVNGDPYFVAPPPAELEGAVVAGDFPDRTRYRDFVPMSLRRLINRALAVSAPDRYQSSSEMRRALEQIVIEKNWKERKLANGMEWRCGWDNRCYEVTSTYDSSGRWAITVKRGASKTSLRRVTALCVDNLTEPAATRRARRILQDFVLGKLK